MTIGRTAPTDEAPPARTMLSPWLALWSAGVTIVLVSLGIAYRRFHASIADRRHVEDADAGRRLADGGRRLDEKRRPARARLRDQRAALAARTARGPPARRRRGFP